MACSSIGAGYRPFKAEKWVRFPYGLLTSERSEVWLSRQFGELEIVGSIPTVLTERTKHFRAEVQLGARLVWDQEPCCQRNGRFDPEVPDYYIERSSRARLIIQRGISFESTNQVRSSRAGCPCSADNRAALSSILRATTD